MLESARQIPAENPGQACLGSFPKVISISSGKGGIGKTNVVANLALAFEQMGKRVCILDADPAMANLAMLGGYSSGPQTRSLCGLPAKIKEVLRKGSGNIWIIPASSLVPAAAELDEQRRLYLLSEFEQLQDRVDILLIDAGTGVSPEVLFYSLAAQEAIHILTPDPSSIRGALALIQVLAIRYRRKEFSVLVNQVPSAREGLKVFEEFHRAGERFLGRVSLDYLGFIPFDEKMSAAGEAQRAVLDLYPRSPSSQQFKALAEIIAQSPIRQKGWENVQFFRKRLFGGNN